MYLIRKKSALSNGLKFRAYTHTIQYKVIIIVYFIRFVSFSYAKKKKLIVFVGVKTVDDLKKIGDFYVKIVMGDS